MSVVWVVLLASALAATVVVVLSRGRRPHDPIDPLPTEHWLIDHLPDSPGLRRVLRRADRRVVGGLGTLLALALVFGVAATVGWIFDGIDRNRGVAAWDEQVARWGSEHATDTGTTVLRTVTHAGDTLFLWALLAIVAGIDFAARRNRAVFAFAATVGVGIAALNNALKWVVDRDRPDVEHLAGSAGSSFPSGHSAAAAACWAGVALLVGRHVSRRRRPLVAGLAALVAIAVAASRALLGVHWLSDVIAGALVGWGWFFLVALAFGGRLLRLGQPIEAAAARTRRVDSAA